MNDEAPESFSPVAQPSLFVVESCDRKIESKLYSCEITPMILDRSISLYEPVADSSTEATRRDGKISSRSFSFSPSPSSLSLNNFRAGTKSFVRSLNKASVKLRRRERSVLLSVVPLVGRNVVFLVSFDSDLDHETHRSVDVCRR